MFFIDLQLLHNWFFTNFLDATTFLYLIVKCHEKPFYFNISLNQFLMKDDLTGWYPKFNEGQILTWHSSKPTLYKPNGFHFTRVGSRCVHQRSFRHMSGAHAKAKRKHGSILEEHRPCCCRGPDERMKNMKENTKWKEMIVKSHF